VQPFFYEPRRTLHNGLIPTFIEDSVMSNGYISVRSRLASKFMQVAGAAALTFFATTSFADTSDASAFPQVVVNYDHLDLAKSEDTKELYSRLQAASRRVCRPDSIKDIQQVARSRACYAQALSDAVANVDRASLTALHQTEQGTRIAQR
jgi:UrcA family protein